MGLLDTIARRAARYIAEFGGEEIGYASGGTGKPFRAITAVVEREPIQPDPATGILRSLIRVHLPRDLAGDVVSPARGDEIRLAQIAPGVDPPTFRVLTVVAHRHGYVIEAVR